MRQVKIGEELDQDKDNFPFFQEVEHKDDEDPTDTCETLD
jgi:hypothetical protein